MGYRAGHLRVHEVVFGIAMKYEKASWTGGVVFPPNKKFMRSLT